MGYYIQASSTHGKAEFIAKEYAGTLLPNPPGNFCDIPNDKALVVAFCNGPFEAAGVAFDEREFNVFLNPKDYRPKKFVLIDLEKAKELTGYKGE